MNALIRLLRRLVWRRMTTVPLTDAEIATLARKLLPIVQQHRQREYEAAVKHIRDTAPMIRPAPIRPYKVEAIEKVLAEATAPTVEVPKVASSSPRPRARVTVRERTPQVATLDPQSRRQSRVRVTVTEKTRTDPAVTRVVADRVGATLARHARQAGREAVTDTADSAGERIGWARVLTGEENCPWCAMLASRGPVYSSERAARFRGGHAADTYHDHCDCEAILVRKGRDWKGREEYERLEDLWATSTAGLSGKDAAKAFAHAYASTDQATPAGSSSTDRKTVPEPKPAESKRDQALRHLPTLRATLTRLLDEGRSEDSEPVKYTRRQIKKFEAHL